MAQNPAAPGVPSDGRGAHFKHYAVKDAPPCDLRTETNLRAIGGVKFVGLTEGADHAALKLQLALALSEDPDITDILVEQQIRASDGSWCQPDVQAMINGKLVAFDVQLAAASLQTIQNRIEFYKANDICHVWLTDAANLAWLSQLAFRDLYLTSGGRIFSIDSDVLAVCVDSATFQIKELSLSPRLAPPLPLHNVWDSTIWVSLLAERRFGSEVTLLALEMKLVRWVLGGQERCLRLGHCYLFGIHPAVHS
ncbi:hypothetical protein SAMN04488059_11287 [Devosia psychrophila]|uniref:DUF6035 domain-containing protein n=1 Tax=Devosia psychrophila TaxID=728005 RepID=A0A1I1MPF8_9HYPH|nr:hypothetical protein SAMN04488059_11287 [Devosia psychrophila]